MRLFAVLVAAAVTVNYHLAATHVLGGDGGWDYLSIDPATKHLFISRSTRVMVVDPQTATVVGEIPDTPGVHGIAIADDLGKGFTSNGRDGTVTVFDLATLKTLATVQTGQKNPDGIAYEPVTKRVFTFNGGSNTATAIDAQTNAVVATIPLGGRPEFPAVDGRGMVYDNIESTSEIVAIDAKTATIVKRFPLGTCQHPSGLSMDQQHRRLFAACQGEMGVVDADTGSVITTVPTGAGTDATRFNPNTQLAFASNGRDATLTVVHEDDPDHFSVLQNAATVAGARTMEIDISNGFVYLVTAKMVPNPHPTGQFDRYTMVPGTFQLLTMQP
jgi:YVTN family beta-propeller protein